MQLELYKCRTRNRFLTAREQVTKGCSKFIAFGFRCFSGRTVLARVLPAGWPRAVRRSLLCGCLNYTPVVLSSGLRKITWQSLGKALCRGKKKKRQKNNVLSSNSFEEELCPISGTLRTDFNLMPVQGLQSRYFSFC